MNATDLEGLHDAFDILAKLREPFPASQVGKLPRSGVELDFVGHGAVTNRLLDVDPLWRWEPVATLDDGRPAFDVTANGDPVGLWIRLTVCGVTRLGFGNCKAGQFDAEKVLIGDAIRNAAMRFGVALDLWIRGHGEDDERVAASAPQERPQRATAPRSCQVCDKSLAGADVVKYGAGWAHEECANG